MAEIHRVQKCAMLNIKVDRGDGVPLKTAGGPIDLQGVNQKGEPVCLFDLNVCGSSVYNPF